MGNQDDKTYNDIILFLNNMSSFTDIEDIPSIPKMRNIEDYQEYVIKNYIRCGAIPKDQLIIGEEYLGTCRNSNKALWDGKEFIYQRTKFNSTYTEKINHFEEDDGYDLFIPLKLCSH